MYELDLSINNTYQGFIFKKINIYIIKWQMILYKMFTLSLICGKYIKIENFLEFLVFSTFCKRVNEWDFNIYIYIKLNLYIYTPYQILSSITTMTLKWYSKATPCALFTRSDTEQEIDMPAKSFRDFPWAWLFYWSVTRIASNIDIKSPILEINKNQSSRYKAVCYRMKWTGTI